MRFRSRHPLMPSPIYSPGLVPGVHSSATPMFPDVRNEPPETGPGEQYRGALPVNGPP
jgi:hypothetical protein